MMPTPEESGPPTHKLVNELSSKQCKNGGETAEGGQSYVDKGIDIIHQKEKLPSSSNQVTTVTNERTGTINIPNKPLYILKEMMPSQDDTKTDTAAELASSNKRFDTKSKVHRKIPIYYLFSLDTISTTNHFCLRMMKAAKTCLLKSGYHVAGCFVSIKNVGCLETKRENIDELGCYRLIERESNWMTSTIPGEMLSQSFVQAWEGSKLPLQKGTKKK